MIPSEQKRNQRLIPLTAQLIQDMLDNEGLEFQTPPGGHTCELHDYSFPNMNETTSSADKEKSILKGNRHHQHRRHRKKNMLKTGSFPEYSNTPDDESNNWERVIKVMRSVERISKMKDTYKKLYTSNSSKSDCETELSDTCSKQCLYIKPSSSDSLIWKPLNHSKDNFRNKNLHWINTVLVPKSETSFLMNQHKLQNYKINSCNTYYTPVEKDIMLDREAAFSFLARPRCQRNFRNVNF